MQTGLCLRDSNAITTSKWKGSYDSDRKYRSEWQRVSCRKLPMDKYANCGTILPKVCNFTNHEKSRKISAPAQCQARIILISKKNFFYSYYLNVLFVTKEGQYHKYSLAFFLTFEQSIWPFSDLLLALFGFLLKFSSGNPVQGCKQYQCCVFLLPFFIRSTLTFFQPFCLPTMKTENRISQPTKI